MRDRGRIRFLELQQVLAIESEYAILKLMSEAELFSDEFARAVAQVGLRAREEALAAGHPVVYLDDAGRYVQEIPGGRRFEVRLLAGHPRESHLTIVRELTEQTRDAAADRRGRPERFG
jgi:hypothetical protein